MMERIDHIVLTVRSVESTCLFYQRVLGMERVTAPGKPTALRFGHCKINVHEVGKGFEPKAEAPAPGAGDFCLVTTRDLGEVRRHVEGCGVGIEVGPVERVGAQGPMVSIYIRDPDRNLVEISRYD